MSGCCDPIQGGFGGAGDCCSLQATTDVGNTTTNAVGIAGGNPAALATDLAVGDGVGARSVQVHSGVASVARFFGVDGATFGGLEYNHAGNFIGFIVEGAFEASMSNLSFNPAADGGLSSGIDSARWSQAFFNGFHGSWLDLGDTSGSLGDEMFVRMSPTTGNTRTATLPSAVEGKTYFIFVDTGLLGGPGQADIDDAAGDTIMGAAGPYTLTTGPAVVGQPRARGFLVTAFDATDWLVWNFVAIGTASDSSFPTN